MNFDYKRKVTAVTVFGEDFEIPTKTAFFTAETNRINSEIAKEKDAVKIVQLTLEGIQLYLGEDFIKAHYSAPADELDTDELGALWLFLMKASAKITADVLKEYASN